MARPSLPKRFPHAPSPVRTKIRTPERGSAEIEGPCDETAGYLLLMVASNSGPNGKKPAAMKKCLDALLEDPPAE